MANNSKNWNIAKAFKSSRDLAYHVAVAID